MKSIRDLNSDFLNAMREELEYGRQKGYVGWDQYWQDCYFNGDPQGSAGMLMLRLFNEVLELKKALDSNNKKLIRLEAADVANFAMFIADIHGALKLEGC